jgi:transcriptional regulator with XRE-family HTH domain
LRYGLQNVKAPTIDEVIGGNLRALRESESLTLAQCADTLTALTDQSFSEAKLSRWETGRYRFTVNDLHLISQLYGVNLLALLKPTDDTTTHIRVGETRYPIDSYIYDFFVDPRGKFTDRAKRLAERRTEGTPNIVDALNDIADQLGDKGRLGDFHSSLQYARRILTVAQKAVHDDPTPENIRFYRQISEAAGDWWQEATKDERNSNGIPEEDE